MLFVLVFILSLVYGRKLETHYIISFHVPLILLTSFCMSHLLNKTSLLFVLAALLLINMTHWNFDRKVHPVQDGLSIRDFKYAASLIQRDHSPNYNVAMDAEGDNRAMPLRYMLNLLNEHPLPYENYAGADRLYFIAKSRKPLTSLHIWEYMSFGPSVAVEKSSINNLYTLYTLERK